MVAPFVASVAPQVSAAPGDEKVQILSFNDYHGHVQDDTAGSIDGDRDNPAGGGEYLSAKLTELRDASSANDTFTVAAGDLIGGSPFFSGLFHDEPSVESLNEMDLDYSGVGNHEFDEGTDELLRMQNGGCFDLDGDMAPVGTDDADDCYFPASPYAGADFQWLAANVTEDAPDGTDDFEDSIPDWAIETTAGGNKIAFIGMTLEGTDELVAASGIAGLHLRRRDHGRRRRRRGDPGRRPRRRGDHSCCCTRVVSRTRSRSTVVPASPARSSRSPRA